MVIDATAAKSQQRCHSAMAVTHPFCRNSAFVLVLPLSRIQEFCLCAEFCVTDRAGLRVPGLFSASKVQLLGLRRKGGRRKRQKSLRRRALTPPLLFPLIHKTWREPCLPMH